MSTLLLDDIGLCLLRQLAEAESALEEYVSSAPMHDYFVTSMNDIWRLDFEYSVLVTTYTDHLKDIYTNRLYWPRLTVRLWADINIGVELSNASDISDFHYIAKKSLEAYRRCEKEPS